MQDFGGEGLEAAVRHGKVPGIRRRRCGGGDRRRGWDRGGGEAGRASGRGVGAVSDGAAVRVLVTRSGAAVPGHTDDALVRMLLMMMLLSTSAPFPAL